MIKYSLGIDISKKDFHACLSCSGDLQKAKVVRSGTFLNTQNGFGKLEAWIKETLKKVSDHSLHIVMEATGVYYENCALYLYKKGYHVHIVLPNKSKKYLEAIGFKSKTDKSDAKGLSRMGLEQFLELWQPLNGFYYTLRTLTRHYQSLQEACTGVINQQEAINNGMYKNAHVLKSLAKVKKTLEREAEAIKTRISEHLQSNEQVYGKVRNIQHIKGLGELTIASILAETNGFELFTSGKQLVSYAGYDVVENQSGMRVGRTKISKKGNSRIRRALHLPALNVVRYNEPVFRELHERTFSRHGIKMKSYVAVQKKLLTTIYYLWKRNEKFRSDYQKDTIRDESRMPFSGIDLEQVIKSSPAQGKATQDIQSSKVADMHSLG